MFSLHAIDQDSCRNFQVFLLFLIILLDEFVKLHIITKNGMKRMWVRQKDHIFSPKTIKDEKEQFFTRRHESLLIKGPSPILLNIAKFILKLHKEAHNGGK